MSAPGDLLAAIVARRRLRLAAAAPMPPPRVERRQPFASTENRFLAALAGSRARQGGALIAEIKMESPRLPSLAGRVDPEAQARLYAEHGAAALSVVVEPDSFGGSAALLTACQTASGLPAVAKDFVVDPVQLRWAAEAGAAAVLLIASLLAAEELARFAALARGLGMVPLVEVHTDADVTKLAGADWELVGVNNRDLTTFAVDLDRSLALRATLPATALAVAESGVRDGADARRLISGGFAALLVGEALLVAADPAARVRELVGAMAAAEHLDAR